MKSHGSIFESVAPAKIVQKLKERIEIARAEIIRTGKLILMSSSSSRQPKSCFMILTSDYLYYTKTEVPESDEETAELDVRGKIALCWLYANFRAKVTEDNKEV